MKLPGIPLWFVWLLLMASQPFVLAELVLTNFSQSRPMKIMAIGDSITDDCSINGAWRLHLEPLLAANGYPFVFVGRQTSVAAPGFTNINHEGYCGAVIGPPGVFAAHGYDTTNAYLLNIAADALAATNNRPDLVMVLAGANDIGRGRDPYQVANSDMATLVDLIFSNAPHAHIILAKITSLQDAVAPESDYAAYATNAYVYNAELQKLVNRRHALGQQVFLADMFSAVDYSTMFLTDHLHPNSTGLRVMANEWMARINSLTRRTNQFVSAVICGGDSWNYCDAGQDLGTNWAQPDFDDRSWSNGAARFGYGDPTVVTPVNDGPNPENKYITTYFRRQFVLPANVTNLNFRIARADGLAIWLNGQKIIRMNLPVEAITYTNLALTAMTGFTSQVFSPRFAPVGSLRAGTNLLAVELHQSSVTNSVLGLDMELFASGYLVAAPSISINQAPDSLVLSWPIANAPAGYSLYSSTNLSDPGQWAPVMTSATTNGSHVVVTQTPGPGAVFFRLRGR